MKSKSVALLFAFATSILGLTAGLLAADKAADKTAPKAAAAPLKKPTLKIDATPVGEVKGLVTSYADALEAIRPAVVSVTSSKMVRQQVPEFLRQFGAQGREQKQSGLGSGVIVSADGFIIANNHVVEEADELKVFLNDDREFTAKVIGTDPKTDIAVIKIEAENLPAATLADSAKLRVGDVVFAIGNPLGVGQTVTMGIVSATGRKVGILDEVGGYEDFIQTDAAINQGNSGGALIDARGRLVGINSAIISTSQGNIGIGFAIPVNLASSI
ncbi:MAG: trypsin-like peptidase domain-containing protein, partial [Opitutus sp.]